MQSADDTLHFFFIVIRNEMVLDSAIFPPSLFVCPSDLFLTGFVIHRSY